jgi:hypothetical protein
MQKAIELLIAEKFEVVSYYRGTVTEQALTTVGAKQRTVVELTGTIRTSAPTACASFMSCPVAHVGSEESSDAWETLTEQERRDAWIYAAAIEATVRGTNRSGQVPTGGNGEEPTVYVLREMAGSQKNEDPPFPRSLEEAVAGRVEQVDVSFCSSCPPLSEGEPLVRLSPPSYRGNQVTIDTALGNDGCEMVLTVRRDSWRVLKQNLCYSGDETATP